MRPSNTGIGYSDSQASAASFAAMAAVFEDKAAVQTNATATFASYHLWAPPVIVAGRWSLSMNALAGGPLVAANTQLEAQFIVSLSGVPLPPRPGPDVVFGKTGGRVPFSFGIMFDLPPGLHTFDLQFRQPGGPGSAQMSENQWSLMRVG